MNLLLTQEDVDVNLKDPDDGWTSLWFVAERCHKAVVEQLLAQKDVDVN